MMYVWPVANTLLCRFVWLCCVRVASLFDLCVACLCCCCRYVLSAIKAAAPGGAKEVAALEKKLNEKFDPYA